MKKRTDRKARPEKKRWNAIDYMFLLLLLLSATGILFRVFALHDPSGGEPISAEVAFLSDPLPNAVAETAQREAALSIDGGEKLALLSISIEPVWIESTGNAEARYLASTQLSRIRCALTVHGQASENGFFLDGRRYFVPGTRVTLTGDSSSFSATLSELSFVDKAAV